MREINIQNVFFELVRAGLWERHLELWNYGDTEWAEVVGLAEEQSVIGLVAEGIEQFQVSGFQFQLPQEWTLQIIGQTLQIEQRNKDMNVFIADTVEGMRKAGIKCLLVKGSGLAQCYEKPHWRSCGDVDFFFSKCEYPKAVEFFSHMDGAAVVQNAHYTKSCGVVIEPWFIEIHGTLRNGLSSKMDRVIDEVQNALFEGGRVRSWQNGKTQVLLPAPTEDVFLVFVHFVRHLYKDGVNIRQICDWCRLLFCYREKLDLQVLESWLKKSGLIGEWSVFGNLAVNWLGMPEEAMPIWGPKFSVRSSKVSAKAEKLVEYILGGYSGNKIENTWQIAKIFPWKALRYSPSIFLNVNWMKVKERVFERK